MDRLVIDSFANRGIRHAIKIGNRRGPWRFQDSKTSSSSAILESRMNANGTEASVETRASARFRQFRVHSRSTNHRPTGRGGTALRVARVVRGQEARSRGRHDYSLRNYSPRHNCWSLRARCERNAANDRIGTRRHGVCRDLIPCVNLPCDKPSLHSSGARPTDRARPRGHTTPAG